MARLNPELKRYYEEGSFPMIRHPLVYSVPFFDNPTHIAMLNKQLEMKKKAVAEAEESHKWSRYIFLHERPYRIDAFMAVQAEMPDDRYWPILFEVWVDGENIFQNRMSWWELLSAPRRKRHLFTPTDERSVLRKMPRELEVYRGTCEVERDGVYLGYSWTLEKSRAEWFANRLIKEAIGAPVVASAKVRRSKIIGYTNTRGEQEIVVEPKELENLNLTWEVL